MPEDTDPKPLRILFVGNNTAIELLRMEFSLHRDVAAVGQVSDLAAALAQVRQTPFNVVVIELTMQPAAIQTTANMIFRIGCLFPDIVFALFGDKAELDEAVAAVIPEQQVHLEHYFRIGRSFTHDDIESLAAQLVQLQHRSHKQTEATPTYHYDVALSFASEDREHAVTLKNSLDARQLSVFYDDAERYDTWGTILPDRLQEVYARQSRFCLILISATYASKPYTRLELNAALSRASSNPQENYILPVRIDSTDLPGLPTNITYLDISLGAERIAQELERRLGALLASNRDDC